MKRVIVNFQKAGSRHVTVGTTSAETGDNAGNLDAAIGGGPLDVAFNVKYLIDVLGVIGANQVALEMTDASTPGVLRIVGDETFTHVIIPMHVGQTWQHPIPV